MSEHFPLWVLLVAAAILLSLLALAAYYIHQLWQLRKRQAAQLQLMQIAAEERRQSINNSIQIIAKAVGSEDVTLTEASIRIAHLLDSLGVSDTVREEFSAFFQLRDATSHIPILDDWRKLDKKEKRILERERIQLEVQYADFVVSASQRIIGRLF